MRCQWFENRPYGLSSLLFQRLSPPTAKQVTDIKLNDRNINGDLLKYLAKTQTDEQPGIRTNTTICLGKIAKHLGVNVSPVKPSKVLTLDAQKSVSRCIRTITTGSLCACTKCRINGPKCHSRIL